MRLIEIPDDGIIHIPIMDGDRTIGHKHIDLSDMPTIELVRCRECKWWHEDDDIGHCDNPDGLDNYAKPDDFCSYGERKEGAADEAISDQREN